MANLPSAYGLSPLIPVFPAPVLSNVDPNATNLNYEPGQLWVNQLSQQVFVLVSNQNGVANWVTNLPFGANPVVTTLEATGAGDAIFTSNLAGDIHSAHDLIADNDLTVTGTATVGELVINGTGTNIISGTSVEIEGTGDIPNAVLIHATGAGGNATIAIENDLGTAATAVGITSTVGGVTITGGLATNDAINLVAGAGGIDVDAALLISLTSTRNNAQAILLESTAGGIDILASGAAAGEDIDIVATGSSVNINSTEAIADSVVISSTNGGIDITSAGAALDIDITATGGSINLTSTENAAQAIYLHANGGVTETIQLHADQGTAVNSINILSDVGGLTLRATGLASADAINLEAAAGGIDWNSALQSNIDSSQAAADAIRMIASNAGGGIDIDCGTTGITIDSTGAFSIDGAAASNITTTGAGIDLTLSSVLGSVLVESTEDAALAIRLHANGGTSETIQIHSDQGTGVGSVNLLSDVGGLTLRATGLASADAINFEAVAGGIDWNSALQSNIDSSQAAVNAIRVIASDVAGGIDVDCGTGGITIDSTGAFSIDGAAASNITTTGAGIDLTLSSVLGSVAIASSEAVVTAISLTASNAAGGVAIDSNGFVSVTTATDTQASPSATSVLSVNVGAATFTGFTTAAAAAQVFTITNALVGVTSKILVTASNEGANDAQMTVTRVKRGAGTFDVTLTNNGAAALNGNVTITFWVLG